MCVEWIDTGPGYLTMAENLHVTEGQEHHCTIISFSIFLLPEIMTGNAGSRIFIHGLFLYREVG